MAADKKGGDSAWRNPLFFVCSGYGMTDICKQICAQGEGR